MPDFCVVTALYLIKSTRGLSFVLNKKIFIKMKYDFVN